METKIQIEDKHSICRNMEDGFCNVVKLFIKNGFAGKSICKDCDKFQRKLNK